VAAATHLTTSGAELLGGSAAVDVGVGTELGEESESVLGLGNALGTVADNEG